jgi:hypothetical protein
MNRTDKVVAGIALAVWLAVFGSLLIGCSSRVRPGVGVSNDGQRVGLDLGTYDTSFAHPVTGVAPGETCVGPDCGIPDPPVVVRRSQIDAAQREIGARSESNGVSWLVGGAATVLLLAIAWVVFSARKVK